MSAAPDSHGRPVPHRRFRFRRETIDQTGVSRQGLPAGAPPSPGRALLGLFLVSLIFSLGIGGVLSVIFPLSPREAHLFLRSLGVWGPIGLIAIIAALIVLVPVSTIPFEIAAGVGYGVAAGTVYALSGQIAGATIAFLLARRFGRPFLARLVPSRAIANMDRLAEQLGVRLLVLMRLLPLFDFKVVSYAAGLTDMTLGEYLLGTVAGITLPALVMVSVGAELTGHPLRAALIVGTFGLFAGAGAAYFLFGRHSPQGEAGAGG